MIKMTTELHNEDEDTCGIAQNQLWIGGGGARKKEEEEEREKAKEQRDEG